MSGKLIVIDGVDGSGKQTQTDLLHARLTGLAKGSLRPDGDSGPAAASLYHKLSELGTNGIRKVEFPTYTRSSTLIEMYLAGEFGAVAGDVNAYAASTFFAVDRYASYKTDWGGVYENGGVILCDRYTTSNAIHQGAKLAGDERSDYLRWLDGFEYERIGLPRPDLVLFLDVPPEFSEKLLLARYRDDADRRDLHERDRAYMRASYDAAVEAAGLLGWERVRCIENGCMRQMEDIAADILKRITELILRD